MKFVGLLRRVADGFVWAPIQQWVRFTYPSDVTPEVRDMGMGNLREETAVSYTHLTLPTKRIV